jgi:membrane-bound metal-dependent hydrolase YbcI (DUF457 family)
MQTYSHFLVTVLGQKKLKQRSLMVHPVALLVGSVLPDLPFTLLTAVYMVYYIWFAPLPVTGQSVMEYRHFDSYFNDPVWIASHNLFHAPLILAALAAIGWFGSKRDQDWGAILFWFAIGARFHSLIDIFTHHNDGPLLLFPLNWSLRFISPVSFGHPDHYGHIFAPLEHLLDLGILAYFGYDRLKQRRLKQATPESSAGP